MTEQEKQLLLKDLCARLPYRLKILYDNTDVREMGLGSLHDFMFDNAEVKPYLRPIEKMTEREWEEFTNIYNWCHPNSRYILPKVGDIAEPLEWLNEHHIDYNGLIGKGLALEAPEGMY